MLVNLLSNAVKFTPGGGRVSLEVEMQPDTGGVRLHVIDTGIGIADGDIGRLFQPFTQLDAGLARHHEGTGLGLALVRQLAGLHGGDIAVESEPGHGSRFTLTLPQASQTTLAAPATALPPVSAGSTVDSTPTALPAAEPSATAKRLLLVEDNEANITAVGEYLQDVGYRLAVARSGAEALACLESQPLPDLVLMDIQMPGMDGLEATQRLRRLPGCERIPVIALTALAMPGDRERCLAAGADDYITKPIGLKHLVATIGRLTTPAAPAARDEMKVL
jgi:CheY-like chemotaxis protein